MLGKAEKGQRLSQPWPPWALPTSRLPAPADLLLGDRRPPVSLWLEEPESMEQEAGEKREPEKPEVREPGLRLRSFPGAGEEEAGEGPAPAPPGWQPEEDVDPLPPSSLLPESGEKGRRQRQRERAPLRPGACLAARCPLGPHRLPAPPPPWPPACAGPAAAPPAAASAVSACAASSSSCFLTAYQSAVRAKGTPGSLSPTP